LRFLFSFLFTAMHVKNLALCVWEWRRYTIQYNTVTSISFHTFREMPHPDLIQTKRPSQATARSVILYKSPSKVVKTDFKIFQKFSLLPSIPAY